MQEEELDVETCQVLNNTILLLRNVLFLAESQEPPVVANELEERVCILRYGAPTTGVQNEQTTSKSASCSDFDMCAVEETPRLPLELAGCFSKLA